MSRRPSCGVPASASKAYSFFDWKYVLEVDFANDSVVMKDAYLQYQGFKIDDTPAAGSAPVTSRPSTPSNKRKQRSLCRYHGACCVHQRLGDRPADWLHDHVLLASILSWRRVFLASVFLRERLTTNSLFPGFIGDEDIDLSRTRGFVLPINREVNGVTAGVCISARAVRNRERGNDQPFFTVRNRARWR